MNKINIVKIKAEEILRCVIKNKQKSQLKKYMYMKKLMKNPDYWSGN